MRGVTTFFEECKRSACLRRRTDVLPPCCWNCLFWGAGFGNDGGRTTSCSDALSEHRLEHVNDITIFRISKRQLSRHWLRNYQVCLLQSELLRYESSPWTDARPLETRSRKVPYLDLPIGPPCQNCTMKALSRWRRHPNKNNVRASCFLRGSCASVIFDPANTRCIGEATEIQGRAASQDMYALRRRALLYEDCKETCGLVYLGIIMCEEQFPPPAIRTPTLVLRAQAAPSASWSISD